MQPVRSLRPVPLDSSAVPLDSKRPFDVGDKAQVDELFKGLLGDEAHDQLRPGIEALLIPTEKTPAGCIDLGPPVGVESPLEWNPQQQEIIDRPKNFLLALDEAGWELLDRIVASSLGSSRGVTGLRLPDSPLLRLEALASLPHLERISLRCSGVSEIDLTGLRSLQNAVVSFTQFSDRVHLKVRDGVFARAECEQVMQQKSEVSYYSNGEQLGGRTTLPGLLYQRSARGDKLLARGAQEPHEVGRPEQGPSELQEHAWSLALNKRAAFSDDPHVPPPREIVCRHLAVQWLMDRGEHQASRARGDSKDRFSYAPYGSVENIRGHVSRTTESVFNQLISSPRWSVAFDHENFGAMLSSMFSEMRSDESRSFIVLTPNHAMACHLQVETSQHGSRRRQEGALAFYDPNRTATHVRAVWHLDDRDGIKDLLKLTFKQCMSRHVEFGYYGEYFAGGQPQIACLLAFDPDKILDGGPVRDSKERDMREFVSEQNIPSSEYLVAKIIQDDAKTIREQLKKIGGQQFEHSQQMYDALRAELFGVSALEVALEHCHHVSVREYIGGIGALPALTPEMRFKLFAGGHAGLPAIEQALTRGSLTRAFCAALLSLEPGTLTRAQLNGLLSGAAAGEKSVLHRLATSARLDPETPAGVREWVSEILKSGLSDDPTKLQLLDSEKLELLASVHQQKTAARNALDHGRPEIAAALICGILESDCAPAFKQDLLDSLGVQDHEVIAAMAKMPDGSSWTEAMRKARESAALPAPPVSESGA